MLCIVRPLLVQHSRICRFVGQLLRNKACDLPLSLSVAGAEHNSDIHPEISMTATEDNRVDHDFQPQTKCPI